MDKSEIFRGRPSGRQAGVWAIMNRTLLLPIMAILVVSTGILGYGVSAQGPGLEPPLRPLWAVTFPGEQMVRAMLVEGGVLYLLTAEGIVHALSLEEGRTLWQTSGWLAPGVQRCPYDPPQMPSALGYSPVPMPGILLALDGDLLVAAMCAGWEGYSTDQQLLLFDRMTGQLRGSLPVLSGRLMNVQNGIAVISSQEGLYALSLREGREVWRVTPEDKYNFYVTGTLDGLAFVQIYDQDYRPMVYALSLSDGSTRWTLPPGGNRRFQAVADGVLYGFYEEEGTYRTRLEALDPQNGRTLWQSDLGLLADRYSYSLRMTVVAGHVYAYSDAQPGGMVTFDAATGSMIWTGVPDLGVSDLQAVGDLVYCIGNDGKQKSLYVLNGADGQVVWSGLPNDHATLGPVAGRVLLVASSLPGVSGIDAALSAFEPRR